jgi:hypothetical protein
MVPVKAVKSRAMLGRADVVSHPKATKFPPKLTYSGVQKQSFYFIFFIISVHLDSALQLTKHKYVI